MNFIEVKDVVKQYDGHRALDGVSLSVPEGCIYGLLGPNGAGKTSLIRIINQITRPDSGEVFFDGRPMTAADVQHIGYLPEERGLYKKMKVADHIIYMGRLKGMNKADAIVKTREWLARFDLTEWAGKKVEALSKGMQQKVQFIATVIHQPKLLIFDEPFSGFDPVNADQLKVEILRLRDQGSTILFSTHNMESVEAVCEQISLINHARVVLQGHVDQIKQQHKQNIIAVDLSRDEMIVPDEKLFIVKRASAPGQPAWIQLRPGVSVRDCIARLNEQYSLTGFHEILPSMHEIFIHTVKTENNHG